MKLLSSTQTATVAGGFVPALISTVAFSTMSSLSVAAGSTILGFGGIGILTVSIPFGLFAGAMAYDKSRSHGGNLGLGYLSGILSGATTALVGNIGNIGGKTSPDANKFSKYDVYCATHDCS